MNFLERLEILRLKRSLTKGEVYQLIDISQAMISMIKSGSRKPSMKMMRRLCAAEQESGIETSEVARSPAVVREPRTVYGVGNKKELEAILSDLNAMKTRVERILGK